MMCNQRFWLMDDGWPSCNTLRHCVPFLSLTTGSATVGIFEPASTRGWLLVCVSILQIWPPYGPAEDTSSYSFTVVECITVALWINQLQLSTDMPQYYKRAVIFVFLYTLHLKKWEL
jgi:hypothetical protein